VRTIPTTIPTLSDGVVTLRRPEASDVEALTAGCREPDVSRYTSIPSPYERHHAQAFVRDSARQWEHGASANFVIVDATTAELLGGCGLIRLDSPDRVSEVGYWLRGAARGRGVMTRAVHLVSEWVLRELGFQRLELQADVRNTPSHRVAERAGFRREGTVPAPERCADRSETMVMFALTREDLDGIDRG
jgi:RimJ/RimL family protein N-acetyltransferase